MILNSIDPLIYMRFSEGQGSVTRNTGSLSISTRLSGVTNQSWIRGKVDAGLSFNDQAQGPALLLGLPSAGLDASFMSVCFWAKPSATQELDQESTSGADGTSGQRCASFM